MTSRLHTSGRVWTPIAVPIQIGTISVTALAFSVAVCLYQVGQRTFTSKLSMPSAQHLRCRTECFNVADARRFSGRPIDRGV